MFPKKISVIGAGAIGAMFGGLIKHHHPSTEVVLIARGKHLRAMQERRAVEIRGKWGHRLVPITAASSPDAVVDSDVVIFTVKTQDTDRVAKEYAGAIGDAVVVSLQNGINQHLLTRHLHPDRVVAGMTSTNMALIEPGIVQCNRGGISVIGPTSKQVAASTVEVARRTLAASGLPIEVSESILGIQYNKLLFNTMGYASVVSSTDLLRDGIMTRSWRNEVALPLLSEGLHVLQSAGILLERVSGMSDVYRFRNFLRALNLPTANTLANATLRGPLSLPGIVFSVYQDLMRRRPTEIDYVNGEMVRLAKESGTEAPRNSKIVQMTKNIESHDQPKFFSKEDVISEFRQLQCD
ncbi:MAG: ketopantoate reductase family protein [Rhodopirellula sp. JB053]